MSTRRRLVVFVEDVEQLSAKAASVAADLRKVYDSFLLGLDELPRARLTERGEVLMAWETEGRYAEMQLVGGGQYEWFTQDYATQEFGGRESVPIDDLKPIRAALEWIAEPAGVAP